MSTSHSNVPMVEALSTIGTAMVMQLNIKNGDAYRLARELAERTGESLTEAVTGALRERLEREKARVKDRPATKAERLKRLEELARKFDELPVLDDREPDEIIGYDESGLPR